MSRKLALIIGNTRYNDQRLAILISPRADVDQLAQVLRAGDVGAFTEVRTLINESASTVRREIARFFGGDKGRGDLLLLYFSGHGIKNERGELHLAVADTETELLGATAISASFVSDEMDASGSRRLVLILDCCHSGAFLKGSKGATIHSVDTRSAFEGSGSGRIILTATDSTQYAWEGDQVTGTAQRSVFTQHLIEGLRTGEADLDGDGNVTVDELYEYVHREVVKQTPKQRPRKFVINQEGELVIARTAPAGLKPAPLPSHLADAIESVYAGAREEAVGALRGWLEGDQPGRALTAEQALRKLAGDDSRRVAAAAEEALRRHLERRDAGGRSPAPEGLATGGRRASPFDAPPASAAKAQPQAGPSLPSAKTTEATAGRPWSRASSTGPAEAGRGTEHVRAPPASRPGAVRPPLLTRRTMQPLPAAAARRPSARWIGATLVVAFVVPAPAVLGAEQSGVFPFYSATLVTGEAVGIVGAGLMIAGRPSGRYVALAGLALVAAHAVFVRALPFPPVTLSLAFLFTAFMLGLLVLIARFPGPVHSAPNHPWLALVPVALLIAASSPMVFSLAAQPPVVAPGAWSQAGALGAGRFGHSATRLGDGTVLVAGGGAVDRPHRATNSTEIFNPDTKSSKRGADMRFPHVFHTATVLKNGRVLVAGGDNENGEPTDTAEIYDPLQGTWTPTRTKMPIPMDVHLAVLLSSGSVLLVDLINGRTNQLYDPASDSWTKRSPMLKPSYQNTAVALPRDRVLVAGGFLQPPRRLTAAAELYDAETDSWSSVASMQFPRRDAAAIALKDGRVLVAGGTDVDGYKPLAHDTVELYWPDRNFWSRASAPPGAVAGPYDTLMDDGTVLVLTSGGSSAAYLYDVRYDRWVTAPTPGWIGEGARLTLLGSGKALLTGGSAGHAAARTAEIYSRG